MIDKIIRIILCVMAIILSLVGGIMAAIAFKWLLVLLFAIIAGLVFTWIMDELTER